MSVVFCFETTNDVCSVAVTSIHFNQISRASFVLLLRRSVSDKNKIHPKAMLFFSFEVRNLQQWTYARETQRDLVNSFSLT